MEKKLIECFYCGKVLEDEELECPYTDDNDDIMCNDCYFDTYQDICSLCNESYYKPTKPEETYFIIAKEVSNAVASIDMIPGLYQCTDWPYFRAAIGFGFEELFPNAVRLLRKFDINKTLREMARVNRYDFDSFEADEVCPQCASKYLGKYQYVRYIDDFTRIHANINNRIIIK